MEGFRPWVKFGLSAYLRQENRWASLPDLATERYTRTALSSTFIGGLIERREGTGLNFSARGELGVLGSDLGAFKLEGISVPPSASSRSALPSRPMPISTMPAPLTSLHITTVPTDGGTSR